MRPVTLTISVVYLAALTYLSAIYPNGPVWAYIVLMVAPVYFALLVIWRTWLPDRRWLGLNLTGESAS